MPATDINDLPTVESYTAAPGQKVFTFAYRLFDFDYLEVTVDGNLAGYDPSPVTATEYSIASDVLTEGGQIEFGLGLTGGEKVILARDLPIERLTRFAATGPVSMDSINAEHDREIAIMQDIAQGLERSIRVPLGETGTVLPPVDERAGQYGAWDALGNFIPSAGTGADAGLRTDLAAADGYSLVGGLSTLVGARPAVTVGAISDQAAIINAVFADPTVTAIILPAGTIYVDRSISVPEGKALRGQGRNRTFIKALPTFNPATIANAVVTSDLAANDVKVSGITCDGEKILPGGIRINGIYMRRALRFETWDTEAIDCTGYGHFAQGNTGGVETWSSGAFRNAISTNCQICFEVMFGDDVLFEDCIAKDGDGDLLSTYFHPITHSKNIRHVRCRAAGAASVGVEITANQTVNMANIWFIDCDIQVTGAVSALVQSGAQRVDGLYLVNSRFACTNFNAPASATFARCDGTVTNCKFDGGVLGVEFNASDMEFTGSTSVGRTNPGGGLTAYPMSVGGNSTVRWRGGKLGAEGPPGLEETPSVSAGSLLYLDPDTVLDPPLSMTNANTNYTLKLSDANRYLRFTDINPKTITVPQISSVPWTVGTVITIEDAGGGGMTVAPGVGVTTSSRGPDLVAAGQYAVMFLRYVGGDVWVVGGDR